MASPGSVILGVVSVSRHGLRPILQLHTRLPLTAHRLPVSGCVLSLQNIRHKSSVAEPKESTAIKAVDIEKQIQENLQAVTERKFDKHLTNPEELTHFSVSQKQKPSVPMDTQFTDPAMVDRDLEPKMGTYTLPHPIWTEEEVSNIEITHREPHGIIDNVALFSIKLVRFGFDFFSGYNRKGRDETVWLNRIAFLETVAGVPGMVGGMVRHLHSLRRMSRDHGWIHTLLEEAENERMHLMTALELKKPSWLFRAGVITTQGVFVTFFSFAYLLSPRFCHRFVGYLEEEAVVTYTKCLQDIETGLIQHWKTQAAPDIAMRYWKLHPEATMKDVILAIRADEAHHRVVNHTLGSLRPNQHNPYKPGQ